MGARNSDMDEAQRVKEIKIHYRYFRKVVAYPKGAVVHHGDCDFYSSAQICTCGLLKDLSILGAKTASKLYEKFEEDIYFHEQSLKGL